MRFQVLLVAILSLIGRCLDFRAVLIKFDPCFFLIAINVSKIVISCLIILELSCGGAYEMLQDYCPSLSKITNAALLSVDVDRLQEASLIGANVLVICFLVCYC